MTCTKRSYFTTLFDFLQKDVSMSLYEHIRKLNDSLIDCTNVTNITKKVSLSCPPDPAVPQAISIALTLGTGTVLGFTQERVFLSFSFTFCRENKKLVFESQINILFYLVHAYNCMMQFTFLISLNYLYRK